jgi:hypothetical protein
MSLFKNLTPHELNIVNSRGMRLNLSPSGIVARVREIHTQANDVSITRYGCGGQCAGCGVDDPGDGSNADEWCDCDNQRIAWELDTFITKYGEVTDLPEPEEGTIYIVSGMVAAAAPRPDVMSPGTLVRDDQGKPMGCLGLRRSI